MTKELCSVKLTFLSVNQQEMTTLLYMFGQFHNSSTQKMERKQFRDEVCNRFQITDDFIIERSMSLLQ